MATDKQEQQLQCALRGGPSFHVEYVLNEPDGIEMNNLTHVESHSADDLAEDELSYGWVAENDDDHGFVMIHLFEESGGDGEQALLHRLRWETCMQLSDMFKLAGEAAKDAELNADAEELALQVEDARINQPLPFEQDEP